MRKLVIAPHVDDDVIGCGGILDVDTTVLYIGVDAFHIVSRKDRHGEAVAVAKAVDPDKYGYEFLWPTTKFSVNRYREDLPGLIAEIEQVIGEIEPDTVYFPFPSYNQDHRAVYDAAMVALRPHDQNHFVKRVLLYEEPEQFWPYDPSQPFVPNYFVPIDIERKLHLYSLMPSQIRGHRSPDMIRSLAAVRGAAIMQPYAEAFQILRWVE